MGWVEPLRAVQGEGGGDGEVGPGRMKKEQKWLELQGTIFSEDTMGAVGCRTMGLGGQRVGDAGSGLKVEHCACCNAASMSKMIWETNLWFFRGLIAVQKPKLQSHKRFCPHKAE